MDAPRQNPLSEIDNPSANTSTTNHWLAESGSTKTDWVCYAGPEAGKHFTSGGINPSYLQSGALAHELDVAFSLAPWRQKDLATLMWYGAGCAGAEPKAALAHALAERLHHTQTVIEHDLLAAARAGLGRNAGMVAILGTGSHVATFNGTVIDQEAISLGYMLGDEGGGVDIGRRLLKAYFYNELPTEEMLYLEHALSLTKDEAIEHLYRRPWPNRWMASLAPLVAQRPFLREAIAQPALEDFAKTHLFPLAARTGQTAFSAIGSVSAYFEAELRAVTVQRLHLTAAMANPLQALVHYHQAHGTEA